MLLCLKCTALLLPMLVLVQDAPVFRSDVAQVHVDVEARQGHGAVAGLNAEDFRVTEDGKSQPIVHVGREEEPLDLILLFDNRVTMYNVMDRLAAAAHAVLRDLRPDDRVAAMIFVVQGACAANPIVDFTNDFDMAAKRIRDSVLRTDLRANGFRCDGFKPIRTAAQLFLNRPKSNRRRAIVMVTDDRGSPVRPESVEEARHEVWNSDAVVLGVLAKGGATMKSIGPPYRGAQYFADETGGDTVATGDAVSDLRGMLQRLRARYSLYYALPPGKSGEGRRIEVQLAPEAAKKYPKAVIRARTAYIAP